MAELLISNMVTEGRLEAVLDQKNSLIEFTPNYVEKITQYNIQISSLCNDVNGLLQYVFETHPEKKSL